MQVNQCHIHHVKRNVPAGPYKQCAIPPRRRCQILDCTLTRDLPGANTFSKTETTRNHPHQNVLVTWMQVKTLHKQQTSHM
jgi:hypothetical protein